jgi:hypothetical protein
VHEQPADRPSCMEAMVEYLIRKGFTTRAEQAEVLQLGPSGEIAIARYLHTARAMSMPVLQRALRSAGAVAHYDGFGWTIADARAGGAAAGSVDVRGKPAGIDDIGLADDDIAEFVNGRDDVDDA